MHRYLFFRHGQGNATCGAVTVYLAVCPRLPGMSFIEIEYLPRVKRRVLCEDNPDAERDMTDAECAIVDAALERMRVNALRELS